MPSLLSRLRHPSSHFGILVGCAGVFFVLFTLVGLLIHQNFGTSAHDLGVLDQVYWRYSKLHNTFSTVLGFPILGDQFGILGLVFGPLYAIAASVAWPVTAQAFSVAVSGLILYDIARMRLSNAPSIAFAIALGYYLHPAVHSALVWQFHEVGLASGLYMGLIWSYLKGNRKLLIACMVALLTCRADMPLTVLAFGLFAVLDKRRRDGIWAIGLALVWWLLASKIVMPVLNIHESQLGQPLAQLWANIASPAYYLERLSDRQTYGYLFQLLFPFGFLALLSPRYLIPALPTLVANVLIGSYKTQILYHYCVSIMPFVFWAAIEALGSHPSFMRLSEKRFALIFSSTVVALTLIAYSQFSALNLRVLPQMVQDWSDNAPKRRFLAELDREIGDKGVAASDFLLPQLSHRDRIYLFPNPWKVHYWGLAGEAPHHPNAVDFIVVSAQAREDKPELFEYLVANGFFRVHRNELGIVVFQRVKQEAADRSQAVAQLEAFVPQPKPAFAELAVSPPFATPEENFRDIQVDIASLQQAAPGNWKRLPDPAPAQPMDLTFGESANNDFQTVYVRTVVTRSRAMEVKLDIGSDDGVTVWLNGRQVHENIIRRGARLGDDQLRLKLQEGNNVVLFRVNNALGGWRLIAQMSRY